MKIRLRIKELREAAGMSRKQLAKKLCYAENTVAHWERSDRIPGVDTLLVVADILSVTLDDLVVREDEA